MSILFYSQLANGYQGLSNMYPCLLNMGNKIIFSSVEQFYQYSKFIDTDIAWAESIRRTRNAYEAKRLGQNRSHPINPSWDKIKVSIMNWGLRIKFTNDDELRQLLLSTADEILIEANPYDKFWGQNPQTGFGQNMMGQCLMNIRSEIRCTTQSSIFFI